jgi:hypothetical protein
VKVDGEFRRRIVRPDVRAAVNLCVVEAPVPTLAYASPPVPSAAGRTSRGVLVALATRRARHRVGVRREAVVLRDAGARRRARRWEVMDEDWQVLVCGGGGGLCQSEAQMDSPNVPDGTDGRTSTLDNAVAPVC